MAPVAGRPFLDYLLCWLRSEGVEDVILCVGHKRSSIQTFVRSGRKWGLHVDYSIERRLLGTGGAVKKAESMISASRVIVLNGDTLLGVNLQQLVSFHHDRSALATLTTIKVADQQRYGSLKLDRKGRITAFLEKSSNHHGRQKTALISGGVYVFEKRVLATLGKRRTISLEKEVFPRLAANRRSYGFVTDAPFVDIGVPEDFQRAQGELRERFRLCDPYKGAAPH